MQCWLENAHRIAREDRVERWEKRRDGRDWEKLQPQVEAGALLTYNQNTQRYELDGVGSIGERFAWRLLHRAQLQRHGPEGYWPLPVLCHQPPLPPMTRERVVQALFNKLCRAENL